MAIVINGNGIDMGNSPISNVDTNNLDKGATVNIDSNITVNVGPGGEYATINEALKYLSNFNPLYKNSGVTATINLKAGFVMNEQVLVSGLNLGWITIVGEDAETIIDHTALTTLFSSAGYPAFGVDKGGISPLIGQLFRFNVEKVGGSKDGLITLGAGSSADVLSGKGIIGAGRYGIYALFGSTVNAVGANFSNAGSHGIHTYTSIVNANGANCSYAGTYGIIAVYGSTINAREVNASNAGQIGIIAHFGSTINANNANASNAGTHGIFTQYGSTINAKNAIIQNQTTGTARVAVNEGSTINATGINTTGGTVTALNQTANTLTAKGIIYQ